MANSGLSKRKALSIVQDKTLSPMTKIALVTLYLTSKDGVVITNSTMLAESLGITAAGAIKILALLRKRGLVERIAYDGRVWTLRVK